jgi:ribosome-associated protein
MTTTEPDWNDSDAPEPPSKSELKRQMHSRQKLGEKLTQLNPTQLATIPLDSTLREAMADYQRFKHKEARRRQLQFIGRLMRDVDIEAIEQAYELTQAGSEASKKIQHRLEQWRDRLIEEGDAAINDALVEFPQMDRQVVRQLVRDALKEKTNNKPPAAYRKLFQYIRQHNT